MVAINNCLVVKYNSEKQLTRGAANESDNALYIQVY